MTGVKGEQDTYFILSASVKGSCTEKKTAVRFFQRRSWSLTLSERAESWLLDPTSVFWFRVEELD